MDLVVRRCDHAYCAACRRPPSGFGWYIPRNNYERSGRVPPTVQEQRDSYRRFCSKSCLDLFYNLKQQGIQMNEQSSEEIAAKATLGPLGDYVVDVGMDKGVGDYTKEEIEGLVSTVLNAYHEKLEEMFSEDLPF